MRIILKFKIWTLMTSDLRWWTGCGIAWQNSCSRPPSSLLLSLMSYMRKIRQKVVYLLYSTAMRYPVCWNLPLCDYEWNLFCVWNFILIHMCCEYCDIVTRVTTQYKVKSVLLKETIAFNIFVISQFYKFQLC